MKRVNNIYGRICSVENLQLADSIARKGKSKQPGVIEHDRNRETNILALHEMLKNNTYKQYIYKQPVQFTGFKLFYKNDLKKAPYRMLGPQDLMKLKPQPIYIQYQ